MTNPTPRLELETSTRDMYSSLSTMVLDVPEQFDICIPILRSLINQDMNGIRRAFRDGFTPFLVPDLMNTIDGTDTNTEVEIRVLDSNGITLGILVDKDVNY